MKFWTSIFLFLFIFSLSCSRKKESPIPTIALPRSFNANSNWGVVTATYLKLFSSMKETGAITEVIPHGEVLNIIQVKKSERGESYWCNVQYREKTGWIPYSAVDIYDSENTANLASHLLNKQKNSEK